MKLNDYHRRAGRTEGGYAVPADYQPHVDPGRLTNPALTAWARKVADVDPRSHVGAGNVVLSGDKDSLKTTMAHILARTAHDANHSVEFHYVPDFLDWLVDGDPHTGRAGAQVLADSQTVDVLILDDLTAGEERPSATQRKALLRVLNHRGAHQLPTVATMRGDIRTLDTWIGTDAQQRLLHGVHLVETSGGENRSIADITQLAPPTMPPQSEA